MTELFGLLKDGARLRRVDGGVTRTYTVRGWDVMPRSHEIQVLFGVKTFRDASASHLPTPPPHQTPIPLNNVLMHILQGKLRPLAEGET